MGPLQRQPHWASHLLLEPLLGGQLAEDLREEKRATVRQPQDCQQERVQGGRRAATWGRGLQGADVGTGAAARRAREASAPAPIRQGGRGEW